MNEKLQFSWGHIVAFVAIITLSYISFMGFTYLTNGNFTFALIGMGITDIVFILFFLGAQQLKASGVKMKRKLVWERIFIFGSPVVFIAGMVPMSHFWTVWSQKNEIVDTFKNSIISSRQLFDDYEEYSDKRIKSYEDNLTNIITNKSTDPHSYEKAGFNDSKARIQRDNMVETLRLQLLSQNYDSLKNTANRWIDNAAQGASTWNVFLLGNTREIKEALGNWEHQLRNFSSKEMSNESITGGVEHFQSEGAKKAISGIESLTTSYITLKPPTLFAVIFGVIIYMMLLLPYFIQDRHTKNIYRLTGSRKIYNDIDETTALKLEEDNDYPSF